jgi:hypothetical protein
VFQNLADRFALCILLAGAVLLPGAGAEESNQANLRARNFPRSADRIQNSQSIRELVSPVAIYGDVDRRMTETEFAQATQQPFIRQLYAPTGTLVCRTATAEYEGSAQVTVANDVITTSAHILADNRMTCEKALDATACVFVVDVAGRTEQIAVERLVGKGFKCPAPPKEYQDWAVMKLRRPVIGITPYQVDAARIDRLKAGDKVVNVCHSSDFQRKDARGETMFPKHVAGCEIKRIYGRFGVASSDCDIGGACSGGSLLSLDDADPALLGIVQGSFETVEQTQRSSATGIPNKGKYAENVWATHHVLVTGEFLATVRKAAGR